MFWIEHLKKKKKTERWLFPALSFGVFPSWAPASAGYYMTPVINHLKVYQLFWLSRKSWDTSSPYLLTHLIKHVITWEHTFTSER